MNDSKTGEGAKKQKTWSCIALLGLTKTLVLFSGRGYRSSLVLSLTTSARMHIFGILKFHDLRIVSTCTTQNRGKAQRNKKHGGALRC